MAVLSWNEILQRDKQAQMTGASGLTPEQLGAIREADLTEGAVNARNIFNQNEINRRNAVAEKNASDMLKANKGAQNIQSAIKLGMMAKEYYPEIKNAVGGAYDYITGARETGETLGGGAVANEFPSAVGAGAGAYEGASAAYQGVSAATAAGLSTNVGTSIGSEAPTLLALNQTGTMGSAAAANAASTGLSAAMTSVGNVAGPVGAYAALAQAAGMVISNNFESNTEMGKIGESLQHPYLGGASLVNAIGMNKTWRTVEHILNPAGALGEAIGCIIVTACTSRTSYEVEITRQYRDKFLTGTQLRGYYVLAEQLVPSIENSDKLKKFVKKHLVDKLVDYGEMKLGLKEKCKLSSRIVSNLFLGLIKTIGFLIPQYTRLNGEVY
jgi:hypothetical protein